MISEIMAEAKDKMDKAVEATKDDFASVRTGRANPAMFQKIMVDYYGTMTPLGQLGGIVSPTMVGMVKDITGSTTPAMYVIGGLLVAGALIMVFFSTPLIRANDRELDRNR